MKNPRIAPQKWSKIKGARFGKDARKKWNADKTKLLNKPHYGLDIKNKVDDPVYSMYGGTIDATGNDKEGWGKWIRVKSYVNGEAIFILYAHLEEYSITSGSVSAGVKIGKAGRTGNLESVIDKGTAVQHIHIEVKKGVSWSSGTYKNPENYTTTKFNDKGEADEKTSC